MDADDVDATPDVPAGNCASDVTTGVRCPRKGNTMSDIDRLITRRSALGLLLVSSAALAACANTSSLAARAQSAESTPVPASPGPTQGTTAPAASASPMAATAGPTAAPRAATVIPAAAGASPVAQASASTGGPTTPLLNPGVVSWVHIGDLHITTGDQQNYTDLKTIVASVNQYLKNGVNFAFISGDNANDNTEAEYQLIKDAVTPLQVPLYIVPGDHDSKAGQTLYKQYLGAKTYQSFSTGGYHFAFLNMLDANGGFGLGDEQMAWLKQDLDAAKAKGEQSLLFGHTYDLSKLGSSGQAVQQLIAQDNVLMLDAGHTHYNDVANDGHAIYATGRNTGQVTEGPVGFVLVNVDHGVVSWKFKQLGSWPFVMITSPTEKLLIVDPSQAVQGTVNVRAKIWDDKGVASATLQVDGGTGMPMQQIGSTQMWQVNVDTGPLPGGDHKLRVNVQGAGGNTAVDEITMVVQKSGAYAVPQRQAGASGNSIGAYADRGLLGNHTAGGAGGPGGGGKGPKGAAPASSGTPGASSSGSAASPAGPGSGGPGGGGKGPKGPAGPATITAVNGGSLTLQFSDGSTQQVTLASNATVARIVSGSPSDLKAGEKVDVKLTTNQDGSRSIQSIEIEP